MPLSSPFWGLAYRILNINHKEELLKGPTGSFRLLRIWMDLGCKTFDRVWVVWGFQLKFRALGVDVIYRGLC